MDTFDAQTLIEIVVNHVRQDFRVTGKTEGIIAYLNACEFQTLHDWAENLAESVKHGGMDAEAFVMELAEIVQAAGSQH